MGKWLFLPIFSVIVTLPAPARAEEVTYALSVQPSDIVLPVTEAAASLEDFGSIIRRVFGRIEGGSARLEVELHEGRRERAAMKKNNEFRIISWNIQTFGENAQPKRVAAYRDLLGHMFSQNRTARILAVQELANTKGASLFEGLMPGGASRWSRYFQDTNDGMDNGFFAEKEVSVSCEGFLFAKKDRAKEGRYVRNPKKALHPVRYAYMRVGDFDFTVINLHLTFRGGQESATFQEFRNVLVWLQKYMLKPGADQDVIILGDFNLSAAGLNRRLGRYKHFKRKKDGAGRRIARPSDMVVLVADKTSRGTDGQPANNYDHFILSGDVFDEEYSDGSAGAMPSRYMQQVEESLGVHVSDHFPISARFKFSGIGNDGQPIVADNASPCLPVSVVASRQ